MPTQYRITNVANGLCLDINHSGEMENMQEGSATSLFIQPFSGNWGQVWEVKNGHIKNAASGFRIHHGNQDANAPFACMVKPTDEKHQVWKKQGECLMCELDGKGLTVAGNDAGSRVEIRPFDASSPPTDCRWKLEKINGDDSSSSS
eukprot:CAMPEP_0117444786 /NCGR_PEP_ID=MMETSP0759-20121206/5436_1 /TAXON_ID=63605 /ORGANISM="Percolomonas cosmopolitus, Strain WS" /LENGTH=146 /DNA_ID=CAMNT_0005236895 /DNA_START=32 /DNA_END=469 /DNA_ORIENTATION=-